MKYTLLAVLLGLASVVCGHAAATSAEVKNLSVNGGVEDGKARLVIEAMLNGMSGERDKVIFATALQHSINVTRDKITHNITATLDILEGEPKELPLTISGEGDVKAVTGAGLLDWSIRQETNGLRTLVLRPRKADKAITQLVVNILAERELKSWSNPLKSFALVPAQPALFNGFVKVESTAELDVQADNPSGLFPVELKYLPQPMRGESKADAPEPLAFQFHGSAYSLPLRISVGDPETRRVMLRDFKLVGQLSDKSATFTLTATARVLSPEGGTLVLLSGNGVALIELERHPDWRLRFDNGRFVLTFDKPGDFPLTLKFSAAVRQGDGWNSVDFRVAPSALQPIVLQGLAADTQFEFAGAARSERTGSDFTSFLPPDGAVKLSWKEAPKTEEGKLFFAAEMLSQISVSPGLMREIALLDFKVMQGELNRVTLLLRGAGEVTGVRGDQVLAWNVERAANTTDRRLVVQLNQPQKDHFSLQVQMQTPLGAFPQTAEATQLQPEGATRYAGYFRIVNEGAVRLEVTRATGLSQISPEQFPESDATRAALRVTGSQRFAYRFSSADYSLRIQADQILPEVNVSQVLAYNFGQNELGIEAEFELDIREAPLRDLLLRVPKGYVIARLNASGLSDHFLRETADQPDAELRLVYGQPIADRQVIQLRLERNQALGETNWILPRIEVVRAKSTRGHVGVSADAGFRLSPERTQALTELATAFFPRKVANLQAAFRISDPAWAATMRIERLPQSVQADSLHLFSIGEGVAYGSSVLNFLISGAPVSAFRIELSSEYSNVEFTGKDIRVPWQKTTNGYVVQLHTPVSGAYTLLATYERPFRAQGDTLSFTGARPLDVQSEQGHTIVSSAYQFQVQPVDVSPGLLPLEPGEVPPEYRLFFDAPILRAFRYVSRPFNLRLALSPLAQGESLSQIVDRASLLTRISKEGQVITSARYVVKNRGRPNFRLTLPVGTELWSATVNGAAVVPVLDVRTNLIPLPQHADPNALLVLDLKLAATSSVPSRVSVAAPQLVDAPVMLTEWKLGPDPGQRLIYRRGSLTPVGGEVDVSGFAQVAQMFQGDSLEAGLTSLGAALALVALALIVWRWAGRDGVYKFSARHLSGTLIGLVAVILAVAAFAQLPEISKRHRHFAPRDLAFLAPVQQPQSALNLEVANLRFAESEAGPVRNAWPAFLAVIVWIYGWLRMEKPTKVAAWLVGWMLVGWAALRMPNGAPWFFGVLGAFLILHSVVPALRRLWTLPRRPKPTIPTVTDSGPATAVAALLVGLLWLGFWDAQAGATSDTNATSRGASMQLPKEPPLAESLTQEIRIEDKFAFATAKLRWQAVKGQMLPLLFEPAVVTRVAFPANALKLVQATASGKRAQHLLAQESGTFDIEVQYQMQITKREADSGFVLPTQFALVNQLTLTIVNLDVDVLSPQAVSVQRDAVGSNTVATLVLSPANDAWIAWKPRSRDVKREKAVFYAELTQLYVPSAGVIEGAHLVSIRPAQGELTELILDVPRGATITDVIDPAKAAAPADAKNIPTQGTSAPLVSLWRFDPDTRKLRITLNPAQSRPFTLLVRSQVATGPMPVEQAVGLLSVEGAANQIGLLGVATGNEVQLDDANASAFTPINLEDFPNFPAQVLANQIAGLTVRRAFRYSDASASVSLKASAVEPDIRVVTQDTLSLGEDRTVLAANPTVTITRAGIFRLSFVMPAGFDVEGISGAALSHWTEQRTDTNRVITLNLRGKSVGQQQFAISLSGPGLKATNGWVVPQLILREAGKYSGTLVIVPEQGMQPQVASQNGLQQLDPQRSGIRQKGVLAFRVLQAPWSLALNVEQGETWVQVTSLQHATVNEAQVRVAANLQYQIENVGLRMLHVYLPTNADSVKFTGDQIGDSAYARVPGAVTNGLQQWEVKLERRMIGQYLLQVSYQTPLPEQAPQTILRGVQAADVNLQRGFVTVQSGGRLQVRVDAVPTSLQPTEWQSIPRALQQNLQASSANFAYRLVEPAFELPLKLDRHEPAKLLPARVNRITFTSVISDDGVMLTQATLEMFPGDKPLLEVELPSRSQFWFAFVNQNGVWPWRRQNKILIPLERQSQRGKPVPVELFYSSRIGPAAAKSLDLTLLAPKFDLPLENIEWKVYLSEKWQVKHWSGTLQLVQDQKMPVATAIDFADYQRKEESWQRGKTQEAEQMLALGNSALERGDPQQARRAFQSAFGLSTHDSAFNEDARVQLHNLKLQQALVGLNVRQAASSGDTTALGARFRDLRGAKDLNYTQQDAKEIIDRNTADDNAAYMKLAEKLVQQQDAAVTSPSAIRANIPEQGRLLTFARAVAVDREADLHIGLEASQVKAAAWGVRLAILAATLALLAGFGWAGRLFTRETSVP